MGVTVIQSGRFSTASFVPTDISGCQVWFDADDASTFTYSSGVVVSQWNDKSGNTRHLTQATVGNQPSRNGTINSRSTVVFDITDDTMATGSWTLAQPMTWFVVGKRGASIDPYATIVDSVAGGGSRSILFGARADSSPINAPNVYAGSLTSFGAVLTSGEVFQFAVIFNGASSAGYKNEADQSLGNPGTSGISTGIKVSSSGSNEQWGGDIAEIIIYNTALGTTDRQNVENYLQTKWGTA